VTRSLEGPSTEIWRAVGGTSLLGKVNSLLGVLNCRCVLYIHMELLSRQLESMDLEFRRESRPGLEIRESLWGQYLKAE